MPDWIDGVYNEDLLGVLQAQEHLEGTSILGGWLRAAYEGVERREEKRSHLPVEAEAESQAGGLEGLRLAGNIRNEG